MAFKDNFQAYIWNPFLAVWSEKSGAVVYTIGICLQLSISK